MPPKLQEEEVVIPVWLKQMCLDMFYEVFVDIIIKALIKLFWSNTLRNVMYVFVWIFQRQTTLELHASGNGDVFVLLLGYLVFILPGSNTFLKQSIMSNKDYAYPLY